MKRIGHGLRRLLRRDQSASYDLVDDDGASKCPMTKFVLREGNNAAERERGFRCKEKEFKSTKSSNGSASEVIKQFNSFKLLALILLLKLVVTNGRNPVASVDCY